MNHECWCDIKTGIATRCNCRLSEAVEKIEGLEETLEKYKKALSLALYYINGDSTWEICKAKCEEIIGEKLM